MCWVGSCWIEAHRIALMRTRCSSENLIFLLRTTSVSKCKCICLRPPCDWGWNAVGETNFFLQYQIHCQPKLWLLLVLEIPITSAERTADIRRSVYSTSLCKHGKADGMAIITAKKKGVLRSRKFPTLWKLDISLFVEFYFHKAFISAGLKIICNNTNCLQFNRNILFNLVSIYNHVWQWCGR